MLILTPFYCIFTFLFAVLTYILAPILALFTNTDRNLPSYLAYFQTFDASMDEGWLGGYFGDYPKVDGSEPFGPTGLKLWWYRVRWLWRNPGYTFDLTVLGLDWYDWQWEVVLDTGTFWLAWNPYDLAFNFVVQSRFIQIKLGWKAWNHYNHATKQFDGGNWNAYRRIPFVCTFMHGVRP